MPHRWDHARMPLRHLPLLLLPLAGLLLLTPARAWDERARQWGTSESPYWKVGEKDQTLSRLCRNGRFNQRRIGEYYTSFRGAEGGRVLVGIAQKNYNLRDPDGKGVDGKTYHFIDDGTSQCVVFVAPNK